MFNDGVNATKLGIYLETDVIHCCPVGSNGIFHKHTLSAYSNKVVPDTLHLVYIHRKVKPTDSYFIKYLNSCF